LGYSICAGGRSIKTTCHFGFHFIFVTSSDHHRLIATGIPTQSWLQLKGLYFLDAPGLPEDWFLEDWVCVPLPGSGTPTQSSNTQSSGCPGALWKCRKSCHSKLPGLKPSLGGYTVADLSVIQEELFVLREGAAAQGPHLVHPHLAQLHFQVLHLKRCRKGKLSTTLLFAESETIRKLFINLHGKLPANKETASNANKYIDTKPEYLQIALYENNRDSAAILWKMQMGSAEFIHVWLRTAAKYGHAQTGGPDRPGPPSLNRNIEHHLRARSDS
jgi:hypothetical protein